MRKHLLILASVFASCVVAQAVSATTVDSTIHFRIIDRKDHLEFVWKRYAHPKAFASYFIVRSEPGGPKAPEAGDIVATTTNRYSTNAADEPSHNGKYYYRLCVNTKDKRIVCSRAASAIITTATGVTAPPTPAPPVPVVVPVDASATDPVVSVLDAAPGEMALTLAPSASGTILSWSAAPSLAGTSARYVLVRSFTTSTPSYPIDGYLAKIPFDAQRSFLDSVYADPAFFHARRWYRVCAVVSSSSVQCGTVATITP